MSLNVFLWHLSELGACVRVKGHLSSSVWECHVDVVGQSLLSVGNLLVDVTKSLRIFGVV